ncbi:MAG: aldo/keto reductase [Bacteroidales bacterium]
MVKRRQFIKILTGASAGLLIPLPSLPAEIDSKKDKWGKLLPLRDFGKTNEKVTMLGLGGFHIGRMNDRDAQATVETAIEGGIRFIDSAESYQDGGSEKNIGKFIVPKYRDEVFIMTKTRATDRKTAEEHLEGSLRRMNTDYLDLWQMHSIEDPEDAENRINQGVLDVMLKAKQEGKVRHIGFTGHTTTTGHNRMIDLAGELETCQLPINVLDPNDQSYINEVLPSLRKNNYGVIAMKTLAGGSFFGGGFDGNRGEKEKVMDILKMQEAMHFVWSLPIDVLVTGPKTPAMLQEKIDLAKSFTGMTEGKRQALIDRVAHFAEKDIEYYKR